MSAPPTFYLCVDCGGTKTAAVLCSSTGAIVGRARAGPSNYAYLGLANFVATVRHAIGLVLSAALALPDPSTPLALPVTNDIDANGAPVPPFALGAAWFAISGVDSPVDIARLTPALAELLRIPAGPRLSITNDVHLLAAPVRMRADVRSAVGCIGGTGSIIVSFAEDTSATPSAEGEGKAPPLVELARTGGWGWILGDEGGGFDVGRTALRTLLVQRDAESAGVPLPPPIGAGKGLRERVLRRFGISDILDVLAIVHLPDPVDVEQEMKKEAEAKEARGAGKAVEEAVYDPRAHAREKRLSALSPLVFQAAFEDGDPLALQVLKECAKKLADQVATVLAAPDAEPSPKRVRAASSILSVGGSVVSIDKYRALVLDALKEKGHVFKYVEVVDDAAAAGAKALVVTWEGSI